MQEAQEIRVPSLARKDPLEGGTATHSHVLAWRIPWTEELGGLPSTGSQRLGHDWIGSVCVFCVVTSFSCFSCFSHVRLCDAVDCSAARLLCRGIFLISKCVKILRTPLPFLLERAIRLTSRIVITEILKTTDWCPACSALETVLRRPWQSALAATPLSSRAPR